jgi:hypothetical protein
MKKKCYLFLIVFTIIAACKKPKTTDDEFKFTKLEGNAISATTGTVKLEWQDTRNTEWNIIVHNLTTGTIKTLNTTDHFITDNININDEYNFTPTALKPIDTANACKGTTANGVNIVSTGNLGIKPLYCGPISISNYSAGKISSTQAKIVFGWTDLTNTSWDLKITDVTLATPAVTTLVTLTEGDLDFPLGNTQLIEVIGKQNGAKKTFNVLVNSDSRVIYSNFY